MYCVCTFGCVTTSFSCSQIGRDFESCAIVVQAMAQRFGFQSVQIIKSACLGVGSYGSVYKATYDELPCVGKILHPTLFETSDPGARKIIERFEQECEFLSVIRHPNIVQYLGVSRDLETQLPVLLMELIDESLTRFLERSQTPVSYHTQVDICHDIALALAYLHSNSIIHRDLSSNNVLLIAGSRAKVTDFGMVKLFNLNCNNMTHLTMCPGTLAYMSPQALDDTPFYTAKLDCFSFGVLVIQTVTCHFPNPGPRTQKIEDPHFPMGRVQVLVPEIERRKSHIDQINPTHPLLPIAIDCLSYNEEDRPSARELCHCFARLKEVTQYGESVQQAQEKDTQVVPCTTVDREMQIRELQQTKEELQQQLHERTCRHEAQIQLKDEIIAAQQENIQQLRQKLEQAIYEQVQEKYQQTEGTKYLEENTFPPQQDTLTTKEESLQLSTATEKRKLNLKLKLCNAAPCTMRAGSATIRGSVAYFRAGKSKQVQVYNSDTEEWSTLPDCPMYAFTLTVVNDLVTAVGGRHSTLFNDKYTSSVFSFVATQGGKRKWVEHFPPMPTKRCGAAVVYSGKALVVAGGIGERGELSTVEVMDTDILQWSTANSMPYPLSSASATVCGDNIYLVRGIEKHHKSTNCMLVCSLSTLLQSLTIVEAKASVLITRNNFVWSTITDLPVFCSTCVTLQGQLLIIGGQHADKKESDTIYMYNPVTYSWDTVGRMASSRYRCLVTVLPGNRLVVVGGTSDSCEETDTVEIVQC